MPLTGNIVSASAVPLSLRRFLAQETVPLRRILVALSGGPDSMALLEATLAESITLGIQVAACWVDHGLRPVDEIAEEKDFVLKTCAGLGVPLLVKTAARGQIEARAKAEGGIESAARRFRYESLETARVESRSDIVLTGHTSDDFIETMVMRLCTGSGSAGLRGIPSVSGTIRRPMLSVSKVEVLQYLASLGRTYKTDSTNAGCDYLRNKVRHIVLPSLCAVFPSLGSSLATLAQKARLDDSALEGLAHSLISMSSADAMEPDVAYIEADAFDASPLAVKTRALYALCPPGENERIPWRLILAAATAAAGKASGRLASGAGLEFVKEGGRVMVRPLDGSHGSRSKSEDGPGHQTGATGYSLFAPGFGTYRIGKAVVCRIYSALQSPGLRLDAFSWPLCIRSRRSGDALAIKGGHKSLDAIASEQRINAGRRDEIVVIEDCAGIVGVLMSACGGRDSYRHNDELQTVRSTGFMVLEMKGVSLHDAIRR